MRTMPVELTSSVEVASTARAQRMQRRTSTEATGRVAVESMLCRKPATEVESMDASESDDEEEEEETNDLLAGRLGMMQVYMRALLSVRGARV